MAASGSAPTRAREPRRRTLPLLTSTLPRNPAKNWGLIAARDGESEERLSLRHWTKSSSTRLRESLIAELEQPRAPFPRLIAAYSVTFSA